MRNLKSTPKRPEVYDQLTAFVIYAHRFASRYLRVAEYRSLSESSIGSARFIYDRIDKDTALLAKVYLIHKRLEPMLPAYEPGPTVEFIRWCELFLDAVSAEVIAIRENRARVSHVCAEGNRSGKWRFAGRRAETGVEAAPNGAGIG